MAYPIELAGIYRLLFEEEAEAIGELNLASLAGRGVLECLKYPGVRTYLPTIPRSGGASSGSGFSTRLNTLYTPLSTPFASMMP